MPQAVKDLVGLFESQAGPSSSNSRRDLRTNTGQSPPGPKHSRKPLRAPARFLKHPLLDVRESDALADSPNAIDGLPHVPDTPITTADFNSTTLTTYHDKVTTPHDNRRTTQVGEGFESDSHSTGVSMEHDTRVQGAVIHDHVPGMLPVNPPADLYEMENLLPSVGSSTAVYTPPGTLRSRSPFQPPPEYDSASDASTSTTAKEQTSSAGTVAPLGPHSPIPATTVFARNAAPLFIPHLDEYISSIPAPSFPSILSHGRIKGKEIATGTGMFPPMDRLAATGKTLDDLEHNSQVAPGWRNRDTIFGILVSAALGLTVRCLFFPLLYTGLNVFRVPVLWPRSTVFMGCLTPSRSSRYC